jgi:hypothetical protein
MPSIEITPQEREIARGIWIAPGPLTESGRVEAIHNRIGRQTGTRGWFRLHFGVPGGQSKPRIERSPEQIRALNSSKGPYHWYSTGTATNPGMNYLSDLIIRPGIEKTFAPLLLYRGAMNRGRAHRMWNFILLMMAAEAETMSDGLKLVNNAAFSQLCGPLRPPSKPHLWSFLWRLYDNPSVTKNIEGLTEYVKMVGGQHCWELQRVDRFSDRIDCAEWRISTHENAGQDYRDRERGIARSKQLFYPFMAHDPEKPDGARDLVLLVNGAVPDSWPEHIRADVCQDMIVGLLSGDIAVGDLNDAVGRYITKHFKTLPLKYDGAGPRISFDQPMLGTEDRPWTESV